MNEIVTADWHAHCWRDAGAPVAGVNRRLDDWILAFRSMAAYAIEVKATRIIQLGDAFHLKKNIPEQARDRVWSELTAVKIPIEFVVGNHDREDDRWDSVTVLPFKSFAPVWVSPYADKDSRNVYVPWLYDQKAVLEFLEKLKGDWNTLYFHGELDGAYIGPMDYQLKSKVTAKQLQLKKFERAFAGHLHRQQETSGVWYPGSLIAINFGEPEFGKGFLHVTNKGVKSVEVPYPKFITQVAPEKMDDNWIRLFKKKIKDNIVRLVTPKAIDAAIIKDFEDANPRLLQVKLERATSLSVESLKTAGSKTLGTLVKSYVEQRQVPDELKEKYIDYGMSKLEVAA